MKKAGKVLARPSKEELEDGLQSLYDTGLRSLALARGKGHDEVIELLEAAGARE